MPYGTHTNIHRVILKMKTTCVTTIRSRKSAVPMWLMASSPSYGRYVWVCGQTTTALHYNPSWSYQWGMKISEEQVMERLENEKWWDVWIVNFKRTDEFLRWWEFIQIQQWKPKQPGWPSPMKAEIRGSLLFGCLPYCPEWTGKGLWGCLGGIAHCSHLLVVPLLWIYTLPVHIDNIQTHTACHSWGQRRNTAVTLGGLEVDSGDPSVTMELMVSLSVPWEWQKSVMLGFLLSMRLSFWENR